MTVISEYIRDPAFGTISMLLFIALMCWIKEKLTNWRVSKLVAKILPTLIIANGSVKRKVG